MDEVVTETVTVFQVATVHHLQLHLQVAMVLLHRAVTVHLHQAAMALLHRAAMVHLHLAAMEHHHPVATERPMETVNLLFSFGKYQ